MISVEGSYTATFKIAEFDDFLDRSNFVRCIIVEETGNVLPTFELQFFLNKNSQTDMKLINYLNEGNIIEIVIGREEPYLTNVRMIITHKIIVATGDERYSVVLTGIYNAFEYLSDCKMLGANGDGVTVLKQVVQEHFLTDFNLLTSKDVAQDWIQPNIPDKQFVDELWMHSYIPNSFIMTAITCDGIFKLKDMKELLKADPKYQWVLTNATAQKPNELTYSGDFLVETETGITNVWVGFGREKTVLNSDTGEQSLITQDINPMLSQTSKVDRTSAVTHRVDAFGLLNDNVHLKYWDAYWQNLRNLIVFSSMSIQLSVPYFNIPPRVLDMVFLSESPGLGPDPASYNAGLYLITRVAINLTKEMITLSIRLNREGLNELQGDLQ
jgi:hypothetical protein